MRCNGRAVWDPRTGIAGDCRSGLRGNGTAVGRPRAHRAWMIHKKVEVR